MKTPQNQQGNVKSRSNSAQGNSGTNVQIAGGPVGSVHIAVASGHGDESDQKPRPWKMSWMAIGSIAAALAAIVALAAYLWPRSSDKTPPNPLNINIHQSQEVHPPAQARQEPPSVAPPVIPPQTPAIAEKQTTSSQPATRQVEALTPEETQLLQEARQALTWAKLSPFLAPSETTKKKASFTKLEPMLRPDLVGLNNIYLYLRQTNTATGEPWMPAATGPSVYQGVGNGSAIGIDWLNDAQTKLLLTERQQLLQKFVPVLLKAGELGP